MSEGQKRDRDALKNAVKRGEVKRLQRAGMKPSQIAKETGYSYPFVKLVCAQERAETVVSCGDLAESKPPQSS